jgi:RNA polymerase sigma factor (sigma-70 family)
LSAPKKLLDLAQRFDADRRHLRSVAFQLLGSVADADDAVQSAWLKASRSDFGAVENLTGWFTTITAHEAFDQLRVRKRRAEQPLADADEVDRLAGTGSTPADEDALLADSVSSALLVVLDRLSPAQRVAFVLHDVFAVPFETIAGLLDRSPAAAKKLASGPVGDCKAARLPNLAAQLNTSRSWKRFWRRPVAAISPLCSSCSLPTWCAGLIGRWFLTMCRPSCVVPVRSPRKPVDSPSARGPVP